MEWQALYAEVQAERKRMSTIPQTEALRLLDLPARKLTQYIKEGYLKEKPSGEIFKYQVLKLLFEMKQEELFQSIS